MKHHRSIRILAVLLVLCLAMTACGERNESAGPESVTQTAAPEETAAVPPQDTASPAEQTGYGYTATETALSEENLQFLDMAALGETFWLILQDIDGGCSLQPVDGGEAITVTDVKGTVLAACGDGKGFWLCVEKDGQYALTQLSATGDIEKTVEIDLGDQYPESIAVDGSGYFYVLSGAQVLVLKEDGKTVSKLSLKDSMGLRLSSLGSGQVVLSSSESSGGYGVRLLNTESIGQTMTEKNSRFLAYGGWQGRALLSGGGNLYTLDTESLEMEALLNWVDCGIDPGAVVCCGAAGSETLYYITRSEAGCYMGVLSRVPADQLPQRETILVGCCLDEALTSHLASLAVSYNRSQTENSIRLVDYTLYVDGKERLAQDAGTLDLVAGTDKVMEQAELLDLSTLFDQEVGEDTILLGVLKQITEEDGVQKLPMSFFIKTLVGNSKVVGENRGWTPEEFAEEVEAHGDMAVMQMNNAYDTLVALLENSAAAVTDMASLLRGCSQIPVEEEALYELESNSGSQSAYAYIREEKLLLHPVEILDFMDPKELSAQVGEDLVYKGYPVNSGNGAMLYCPAFLGISADSQQTEAAWAFLKTVLTGSGEYLLSQDYGFPILLEEFSAMGQAACQKVHYEDENGNAVEENPVIWVDGEPQEVEPLTEGELNDLMAYIDGCSGTTGWTDALMDSSYKALESVIKDGVSPEEAAEGMQAQ